MRIYLQRCKLLGEKKKDYKCKLLFSFFGIIAVLTKSKAILVCFFLKDWTLFHLLSIILAFKSRCDDCGFWWDSSKRWHSGYQSCLLFLFSNTWERNLSSISSSSFSSLFSRSLLHSYLNSVSSLTLFIYFATQQNVIRMWTKSTFHKGQPYFF